ncbi:MAG TPA: hydroxymethylglutaryl-CoA lyase [Chitinophagaceae bacterium]|jgi:hydroxymethylglutaryl-CoA lyase|nr:hydroxymethylglutaryl-CoA lyase [Chitinophagaceae bacterium]
MVSQMSTQRIKIVECPRDAMQGWNNFIPTPRKIEYINSLLAVGFDTIDFGSFVSRKAIPQMADTKEVIQGINVQETGTKLLAIVANARGAEEASAYDQIHYLGFPFSVSETFQQRNTNSSITESLTRVQEIQAICARNNKQLVIYISMGFGNPYGDIYSEEIVFNWVNKIIELGIQTISLADTVGVAKPEQVYSISKYLVEQLPQIEIGVHLHSRPDNWKEKLEAAINAGCKRFDGALKGFGGCPMANDDLVGNMRTEWMIEYFKTKGLVSDLNKDVLAKSLQLASEIFV